MKKRIALLPLFISPMLFSCGNETNSNNASAKDDSSTEASSINAESSDSTSEKELTFKEGSSLIFTEFFKGDLSSDRAVEISNIGNDSIDLNKYSIVIYKSGSFDSKYEIKLSGTLEAKKSYVVAYVSANDEIKKVANQLDDQFPNIGYYPMVITDGTYIYDTLGTLGFSVNWCDNVDLVRKNEYMVGKNNFEPYDWIGYANTDYSRLGVLECPLSEEEILKGPRIASPFTEYSFFKEGSTTLGGGGFIDVTINSLVDGDTTKFNYPSEVNNAGFRNGTSVRYQNIDTPEIDHGGASPADPWGDAAKDYTGSLLTKAKRIRLQSLPNVSITETFGRLLLYVWASNETSGDDSFYMVNYDIVLNGYSKVAFAGDTSGKMLYKGISYYQFLIDANNKAAKEGLKVHGEKDPNYNY